MPEGNELGSPNPPNTWLCALINHTAFCSLWRQNHRTDALFAADTDLSGCADLNQRDLDQGAKANGKGVQKGRVLGPALGLQHPDPMLQMRP